MDVKSRVCEYSKCNVIIENPTAKQKYCCETHRVYAYKERHFMKKEDIIARVLQLEKDVKYLKNKIKEVKE